MSCSRAARRARVAAHRSSTKHVGRLFPGSILGLPVARETMGARAEVILASAPVLELRLGRAQHHRVVPRSLPVAPAVSAILAGAKSDFMSSDWPGQPCKDPYAKCTSRHPSSPHQIGAAPDSLHAKFEQTYFAAPLD